MPPSSVESPARSHVRFGIWLWTALALAGVIMFYTVVLALNWPFTKQALIDTLQQRSLRQVMIYRFHSTYFPPGCVAEGISFLHIKHKNRPPLLSIQKLVIEDRYPELLTFQHRLTTVRVIGLHVTIPPAEPAGEPSPAMPLTYSKSGASMPIDALFADGAVLDLLSGTPGKPAFRITVSRLALHNLASDTPVTYDVTLNNSDLPGEVRSTGAWGPWNPKQPGATPIRGEYVYRSANLAAFPAISGTLNSTGKFNGQTRLH